MTHVRTIRTPLSLAVLGAAALLSACGGSSDQPAPGTPGNPLVAQSSEAPQGARRNEAAAPGAAERDAPGYKKLLERQPRAPRSRFTPCNLVPERQARAIVGAPIEQPFEAPQGPTCIYRSRDGKRFITLAVQSVDVNRAKRQLRERRRVDVSGHTGYCGRLGQDLLYVKVSRGRVLSVAAPCTVAKRFAVEAVQRLDR
jgi:hypothetical protein